MLIHSILNPRFLRLTVLYFSEYAKYFFRGCITFHIHHDLTIRSMMQSHNQAYLRLRLSVAPLLPLLLYR